MKIMCQAGKGKTTDLIKLINNLSCKEDKEFIKNSLLKEGLPLKVNYFSLSLNTIEELKSSNLVNVFTKQELVTEWNGNKVIKGAVTYLILDNKKISY